MDLFLLSCDYFCLIPVSQRCLSGTSICFGPAKQLALKKHPRWELYFYWSQDFTQWINPSGMSGTICTLNVRQTGLTCTLNFPWLRRNSAVHKPCSLKSPCESLGLLWPVPNLCAMSLEPWDHLSCQVLGQIPQEHKTCSQESSSKCTLSCIEGLGIIKVNLNI